MTLARWVMATKAKVGSVRWVCEFCASFLPSLAKWGWGQQIPSHGSSSPCDPIFTLIHFMKTRDALTTFDPVEPFMGILFTVFIFCSYVIFSGWLLACCLYTEFRNWVSGSKSIKESVTGSDFLLILTLWATWFLLKNFFERDLLQWGRVE